MKHISIISRSLVATLADALEAVDVAFRSMVDGTVLPSMNNAPALPHMNARVETLQARFHAVARKCGVDLHNQEITGELYYRAYREIDRRELDRASSIRMKRIMQQQRDQEAFLRREMLDEAKRQGAFEMAIQVQ